MTYVSVIHRKESTIKNNFMKYGTIVVVAIYGYLLAYFFLFKGCEELIKFWVVGNLIIIVAFVALRYAYIIIFKGRLGFAEAITKSNMNTSTSDANKSFMRNSTFRLADDFYSITFFCYIYIDNKGPDSKNSSKDFNS